MEGITSVFKNSLKILIVRPSEPHAIALTSSKYQGVKIWNILSASHRNLTSINRFSEIWDRRESIHKVCHFAQLCRSFYLELYLFYCLCFNILYIFHWDLLIIIKFHYYYALVFVYIYYHAFVCQISVPILSTIFCVT